MIDHTKFFFIYGLGISGLSCLKFFRNFNYKFKAYDDQNYLNDILKLNEKCNINNIKKILDKVDFIIVSPSINIDEHNILKNFKIKIIIDLDLLGSIIPNKIKLIGITGTEAKSTVCSYLNDLLNINSNSILIGNFGKTILDKKNIFNILKKINYLVIELSSYQLDKVQKLSLDIALITNLSVDHLKYHKSYNHYIKSKINIINLLKKNSKLLITKDVKKVLKYNNFKILKSFQIYNSNNKYINTQDPFFNINISTVDSVLNYFNLSLNIKSIKSLKSLPFRNELIVNTKKLKIINDSKSTNISNSIKTFNLIPNKNKILILGGIFKNHYEKLPKINNSTILFFNSSSEVISNFIDHKNCNLIKFLNLKETIIFISYFIKSNPNKLTILFSPGGESFDMFQNYLDRGLQFNKLIKKYIK